MISNITPFDAQSIAKTPSTSKKEKSQQDEAKSKYLTVVDGNYSYTYLVIGDNFKVLLSRVPVKEEEKDEKAEAKPDKTQTTEQIYGCANGPYQNSKEFLACRELVETAKKNGLLPG